MSLAVLPYQTVYNQLHSLVDTEKLLLLYRKCLTGIINEAGITASEITEHLDYPCYFSQSGQILPLLPAAEPVAWGDRKRRRTSPSPPTPPPPPPPQPPAAAAAATSSTVQLSLSSSSDDELPDLSKMTKVSKQIRKIHGKTLSNKIEYRLPKEHKKELNNLRTEIKKCHNLTSRFINKLDSIMSTMDTLETNMQSHV